MPAQGWTLEGGATWTAAGDLEWQDDPLPHEGGGVITRDVLPNPLRGGPRWLMVFTPRIKAVGLRPDARPIQVSSDGRGGPSFDAIAFRLGNLAGYFARAGHRVMLGDIDRQQSSRAWLTLRSPALPTITSWDIADDRPAKPPKDTTHVVLDTPAGLHGKKLTQILKQANRVIVPLQASIFDILATRDFLQQLAEEKSLRQNDTFVDNISSQLRRRLL